MKSCHVGTICKQIGILCAASSVCKSLLGGGGFVALLHEIGRKTCRKRDKQGGNRLGLFTRKKKDNAPENRPVPRHIAVIMDGNGRWAKKRGLPRKAGHKVGAETFRTIATYCKDIGVQYFTVYAFSTENWKRPQDEVDALMNLFRSYLKEAAETMFERGVAVRVLGDLTVLPEDIRAQIAEVDEIADRLGPDAATASLCINYGGRDEIKNAVRAIAEQVRTASWHLRISPRIPSPPTCTPRICPIPTSSSVLRARSARPTSCCGSPLTRSTTSPMCCGRTSKPPIWMRQSTILTTETVVSAAY